MVFKKLFGDSRDSWHMGGGVLNFLESGVVRNLHHVLVKTVSGQFSSGTIALEPVKTIDLRKGKVQNYIT